MLIVCPLFVSGSVDGHYIASLAPAATRQFAISFCLCEMANIDSAEGDGLVSLSLPPPISKGQSPSNVPIKKHNAVFNGRAPGAAAGWREPAVKKHWIHLLQPTREIEFVHLLLDPEDKLEQLLDSVLWCFCATCFVSSNFLHLFWGFFGGVFFCLFDLPADTDVGPWSDSLQLCNSVPQRTWSASGGETALAGCTVETPASVRTDPV